MDRAGRAPLLLVGVVGEDGAPVLGGGCLGTGSAGLCPRGAAGRTGLASVLACVLGGQRLVARVCAPQVLGGLLVEAAHAVAPAKRSAAGCREIGRAHV